MGGSFCQSSTSFVGSLELSLLSLSSEVSIIWLLALMMAMICIGFSLSPTDPHEPWRELYVGSLHMSKIKREMDDSEVQQANQP